MFKKDDFDFISCAEKKFKKNNLIDFIKKVSSESYNYISNANKTFISENIYLLKGLIYF